MTSSPHTQPLTMERRIHKIPDFEHLSYLKANLGTLFSLESLDIINISKLDIIQEFLTAFSSVNSELLQFSSILAFYPPWVRIQVKEQSGSKTNPPPVCSNCHKLSPLPLLSLGCKHLMCRACINHQCISQPYTAPHCPTCHTAITEASMTSLSQSIITCPHCHLTHRHNKIEHHIHKECRAKPSAALIERAEQGSRRSEMKTPGEFTQELSQLSDHDAFLCAEDLLLRLEASPRPVQRAQLRRGAGSPAWKLEPRTQQPHGSVLGSVLPMLAAMPVCQSIATLVRAHSHATPRLGLLLLRCGSQGERPPLQALRRHLLPLLPVTLPAETGGDDFIVTGEVLPHHYHLLEAALFAIPPRGPQTVIIQSSNLQAFSLLYLLPRVESLTLRGSISKQDDPDEVNKACRALSRLQTLRILKLEQCALPRTCWQSFSAALTHTKLHVLSMPSSGLTAASMPLFARALGSLTYLEELDLSGCSVGHAAHDLSEHLSSLKYLAVLNLRNSSLGPGSEALGHAISGLKRLECLDISHNALGPAALGLGDGRQFKALKELRIDGCDLKDEGVVKIAACLAATPLSVLHMSRAGVGCAGVEALAAVSGAWELKELNLGYNLLGGALEPLSSMLLSSNTTIESIDITACDLGEEASEMLGQSLKDASELRVLRLGDNHLGSLGLISNLACLDTIILSGGWLGTGISNVPSGLSHLDLSDTHLDASDGLLWSALGNCTRLRYLDLGTVKLQAKCSETVLSCVETVLLDRTEFIGDSLSFVLGSFGRSLTKLILTRIKTKRDRYHSSLDALEVLLALIPRANLKELAIGGHGTTFALPGTPAVCEALSSGGSSLETLSLSQGLKGSIRDLLSSIGHLPALKSLDLSCCELADHLTGLVEGLEATADSSTLERLDMSFTDLGPQTGVTVARILTSSSSSLHWLGLKGAGLGAEGLSAVAAAAEVGERRVQILLGVGQWISELDTIGVPEP
eukprot:gnl/Dysnectes_brevis/4916_a6830_415.p1 GENE.gnl/Dysnectes_brevis/4916_a6830_415~~gnl/Dysnectes_brevis/4916_a6830_415.p1  ORF type:complete len:977 (-),score=202.90 gnl/Dysnectes_brevis/4916_a6830_415:61-2991(-)